MIPAPSRAFLVTRCIPSGSKANQADLTRCHVARDPLEPGERLGIALSYLASGQEIPSIALAYRVGIETARLCTHLSCRALWARLKDHVMKGTFSIVLMAVVDSECKYVLIDVGAEGASMVKAQLNVSGKGPELIERNALQVMYQSS
ncbi:hypothetical protein HPB49_009897 [Dermacentor silvarum]|uniref:Uncharacterized protein n=1 Tax=Dermacentor silvarum TaxID=543639 RepID=A0ACB8C8L5_DERSI|nr:hypothetical protein HPB49_009897 [Dermacentor silvarum]